MSHVMKDVITNLSIDCVVFGFERSRRVDAPRNADREQPAQRDETRHDPQRLVIPDAAEQHRGERHDKKLAERALVTATIDAFDREWSRFRNDSLVASLARGAGVVDAPPDAKHMLDLYAEVSDATSGAVQPLVGDVLAALCL